MYRESFVLYQLPIGKLLLTIGDNFGWDITRALRNGRSSYTLFEDLVGFCTGLAAGSRGTDLAEGYEVKSFQDEELHPKSADWFHTAASTTGYGNKRDGEISSLVAAGNYKAALKRCGELGYDKNKAYIYTNTGGFLPTIPFRYVIVPKSEVLRLLSKDDPRLISRRAILSLVKRTETINPATL